MTPRESRRNRRAAERKQRKAEIRRAKADQLADPELQSQITARNEPAEAAASQKGQPEPTLRDWLAAARKRAYPNGFPAAPPPTASPAEVHVKPTAHSLLEFPRQNTAASDAYDAAELHDEERTCTEDRGCSERISSHVDRIHVDRAAINRANAQFSTGPRTTAGKCASSRNSTKHGLASGVLLIPGEDPEAFQTLLNDLLHDHQPTNRTETLLVEKMAQSYWLEQRAIALQNECFTGIGIDQKSLSLYLRYGVTHHRAFHKALSDLQRLQKERKKAPCGFVSQTATSHATNDGFVSQTAVANAATLELVRQTSPATSLESGFVSHSAPQSLHPEAEISSQAA